MAESLKRMGYIKGENITESSNKENSTEMDLVFTPADSSKCSKVCSTPLSPAKRTLFNPFKIAADITNTSLGDCDRNPSQRQGMSASSDIISSNEHNTFLVILWISASIFNCS